MVETNTPELQLELAHMLNKLSLPIHIPCTNRRFIPFENVSVKTVVDLLLAETADYVKQSGLKAMLIPMSGGADSTLVACLLHTAKVKYNLDITLVGVTLPCKLQSDADHYNDLGLIAARRYCDEVASVNIGKAFDVVNNELFGSLKFESGKTLYRLQNELSPNYTLKDYKIDQGNIAARLRMIFAYGWARKFSGAQPSTDNLSELMMGFWTLCGDEGHFKLIQKIFKGLEQPQIMTYLRIDPIFIVQKPTDGLGVSDGDVAQLFDSLYTGKETYYDVDVVLLGIAHGSPFPDPLNPKVHFKDHPVYKQYVRSDFKRNVFCIERSDLGLEPVNL